MLEYKTCETAWCPGCGNFVILDCLKTALEELAKKPQEVVLVAGIGQAAKIPQYLNVNAFCGLHGRALPPAAAIKMANDKLTVIVSTGDGDTYGEGGNHFIHNIRRNTNITHFVHDNQIYGLTKGQASPTSQMGFISGIQPDGNVNAPINPLLLAISAGAGFVARGFTGKRRQLIDLMKAAITYKGYALLDIYQPCVTFNKVNTFQWYNKRVYELDESYDPSNKLKAMEKVMESDENIPIGIIYQEEKAIFSENNEVLKHHPVLVDRKNDVKVVEKIMQEYI